jgi:hypothetical protein
MVASLTDAMSIAPPSELNRLTKCESTITTHGISTTKRPFVWMVSQARMRTGKKAIIRVNDSLTQPNCHGYKHDLQYLAHKTSGTDIHIYLNHQKLRILEDIFRPSGIEFVSSSQIRNCAI